MDFSDAETAAYNLALTRLWIRGGFRVVAELLSAANSRVFRFYYYFPSFRPGVSLGLGLVPFVPVGLRR